jgi:hypothetical protein
MPAFAERLWNALGYRGSIRWSDDIAPVPPGQPIALAAGALLPTAIDMSPLMKGP